MPDLIRHPETVEKTGFRLPPEWRFFMKAVVYKQALNKNVLNFGHLNLGIVSN
jgi:hypothetical protein